MSMVRRAKPDASSLEEANEIVRGNWLNAIEQHHQQYSRNLKVRDILDIGCSVGVSTKFLADKFPSAKLTGLDLSPYFLAVAKYKEKRRPNSSNSFQWIHANGEDTGLDSQSFDIVSISYVELLPVLFTLMKSTEPFLDEYYLLDLEKTVKEAGFINVQTILTDPRHRTLTATVPY
ncbi:hypothetical protein QVD17_34954 [Tagetes erecta]|uniref:Methyltransferase domain-containing protein n=1 Tax=Tagetes erecta TaxID=13708 RepID=A0AAD8K0H2_TARER|nr:hypothetical protein QVD17_34954 [Tagetes erecta]